MRKGESNLSIQEEREERRLYRRCGFVDVGELVLDLGSGDDGLK